MKIECPACGKEDEVPDDFRWRPFCSRRCKLADLGAWFDEAYKFSRPLREDELPDPDERSDDERPDDEHLM